jgi:hypothetical protein
MEPRELAERITGLEVERVEKALEECANFGLARVNEALLTYEDLDSLVGATLLAESVRELIDAGVPETKLMGKLRRGSDFWADWAEIQAASIISRGLDGDGHFEMEPRQGTGKNPDFRISAVRAVDGVTIEFKAVGRSDSERRFMSDAAELFQDVMPAKGLVTGHSPSLNLARPSRQQMRQMERNAAKVHGQVQNALPGWPDIRGACFVGHGFDQQYANRLRGRLEHALTQLPTDEDCWVAFWWANGAPTSSIPKLLSGIHLPDNVHGVIVLGMGLAFPWPNIHVFQSWIDRPLINAASEESTPEQTLSEVELRSLDTPDDLARRVFERFESASGTRAIRVDDAESGDTVLLRDGTHGIDPFNVIFDADPRALSGGLRPASAVQDVRLNQFV